MIQLVLHIHIRRAGGNFRIFLFNFFFFCFHTFIINLTPYIMPYTQYLIRLINLWKKFFKKKQLVFHHRLMMRDVAHEHWTWVTICQTQFDFCNVFIHFVAYYLVIIATARPCFHEMKSMWLLQVDKNKLKLWENYLICKMFFFSINRPFFLLLSFITHYEVFLANLWFEFFFSPLTILLFSGLSFVCFTIQHTENYLFVFRFMAILQYTIVLLPVWIRGEWRYSCVVFFCSCFFHSLKEKKNKDALQHWLNCYLSIIN